MQLYVLSWDPDPDYQLWTTNHCVIAAQGSFLQSFLADSANMGPDERGHFLEEPPEGAPDIDKAHEVVFLFLKPPTLACST